MTNPRVSSQVSQHWGRNTRPMKPSTGRTLRRMPVAQRAHPVLSFPAQALPSGPFAHTGYLAWAGSHAYTASVLASVKPFPPQTGNQNSPLWKSPHNSYNNVLVPCQNKSWNTLSWFRCCYTHYFRVLHYTVITIASSLSTSHFRQSYCPNFQPTAQVSSLLFRVLPVFSVLII